MKQSLREILDMFAHIDDDMPAEEFDPAKVVGDCKDKVDAIKWKIDSWEAEANAINNWIKALVDRRNALGGKSDKLAKYLKEQMLEHGFQKLPGNIWRAQVQNIADKVELLRLPEAKDVLSEFGDLVRQKIDYSWDKRATADKLKSGEKLPFAYLQPNKSLRFYTVNKEPES